MGKKKTTNKKTTNKTTKAPAKKAEAKVEAQEPKITKGQAKGLIDALDGKADVMKFAEDNKIDITGITTKDDAIAVFYEHFGIDAETEVEELSEEQVESADNAEATPEKTPEVPAEKTPEEEDEVDTASLDLPDLDAEATPDETPAKKAPAKKLVDTSKYFATRNVRVNNDKYAEGAEIKVTKENSSLVKELVRKEAIKKGRIA